MDSFADSIDVVDDHLDQLWGLGTVTPPPMPPLLPTPDPLLEIDADLYRLMLSAYIHAGCHPSSSINSSPRLSSAPFPALVHHDASTLSPYVDIVAGSPDHLKLPLLEQEEPDSSPVTAVKSYSDPGAGSRRRLSRRHVQRPLLLAPGISAVKEPTESRIAMRTERKRCKRPEAAYNVPEVKPKKSRKRMQALPPVMDVPSTDDDAVEDAVSELDCIPTSSTASASLRMNGLATNGEEPQQLEAASNKSRTTHITIERNRRKQMNEHLAILRSLLPASYVRRADQASIIGGVIEFIKELKEVAENLEGRKRRRAFVVGAKQLAATVEATSPTSVLLSNNYTLYPNTYSCLAAGGSPKAVRSTTGSRVGSPTPASITYSTCTIAPGEVKDEPLESDPAAAWTCCRSSDVADVEVQLVEGAQLLLRARSTIATAVMQSNVNADGRVAAASLNSKKRAASNVGLLARIVEMLEGLSLQIVRLHVSSHRNSAIFSFSLNIGIDCRVSVEELADAVQHIFKAYYYYSYYYSYNVDVDYVHPLISTPPAARF